MNGQLWIYWISIMLACACTQPPVNLEIPPPPNDPNVSAANQAFLKGDWETLRALLTRLPGEGANLSKSLFYQAVILGLEKPQQAAKKLKNLQLSSSILMKQRATVYRLIFKARGGDCLLTEGPLRRVYWPKIKSFPAGTRMLLEETLRACDEKEQVRHAQVNELTSIAEAKTKDTLGSDEHHKIDQPPNQEQPKKALQVNLNDLTAEQRRGVSPYLQLWLPLAEGDNKRAGINILLSESSPLLIEERELRGERLELERLDISVEGNDSVSVRIAEMRSEVDALIAVTPSRELHDAVLAVTKTQQRPLFIFTPFKLNLSQSTAKDTTETVKTAPVWRIFPDRSLIAKSLVKIAVDNGSQGVGLIVPEGRQGADLLQLFKTLLNNEKQKTLRHRTISSTSNWNAVATEIRRWPVDTIIFASIPNLSVTSLVTHLASKGIWSADRHHFSDPIDLKANEPTQDLLRRFILWPSAYEQVVLDQAGRYLEGARTVTPVIRESEHFKALDQRLRKEVGRGAELLDAIMLDVLNMIDEAIRVSEIKQLSLRAAFQEVHHTPKYLASLDFKNQEPMSELFVLEVHDQQFQRLKESTNHEQPKPIDTVDLPKTESTKNVTEVPSQDPAKKLFQAVTEEPPQATTEEPPQDPVITRPNVDEILQNKSAQ